MRADGRGPGRCYAPVGTWGQGMWRLSHRQGRSSFRQEAKFYRPTTGVRQRKLKEDMFQAKFQELATKLPLPMYGFL